MHPEVFLARGGWMVALWFCAGGLWAAEPALPGTELLPAHGELAAEMVTGIHHWLERETELAAEARHARWQTQGRDEAWRAERRAALRQGLGMVEPMAGGRMERYAALTEEAPGALRVQTVRWPAWAGVDGEGVLVRPAQPRALVVALLDPDGMEAQLQALLPLTQTGCALLMPVLVSRESTLSGNPGLGRMTTQPHREWIYRQAFEHGRTLIGLEVQKVLAAVEALPESLRGLPRLLVGYGEGGLLALHAAALEPRFRATLVSGYFGPRERVYREPIYRNTFGLLREFGDAELAALASPGLVVVEPSAPPSLPQPLPTPGRMGPTPGVLEAAPYTAVQAEVARAQGFGARVTLLPATGVVFSPAALRQLLEVEELTMTVEPVAAVVMAGLQSQQARAVQGLEQYVQNLRTVQERERKVEVRPGAAWEATQAQLRERLWASIGRLPGAAAPLHPRTRLVQENARWTAYEVVLDVRPEVMAGGWLLLPKDLQPGERRPVVVCQHGLEGQPEDTVTEDPSARAFASYKGFAARLCEQGLVVYAPQNPYRWFDRFREINRRANPLGLSLFSFIVAQHEATLSWLGGLPFVDASRIGFYGLSYGGKTAMRVPALVPGYALSICSGDFNEWIAKNSSTSYRTSYMFSGEYEIFEWNLGANAGYAEMAMLIAPRPFMVERGHEDGVATDEWVGYEYAKVRRGYTKLGVPERTEIEWFEGPHTIHGVGTFEFLRRHLRWPGRRSTYGLLEGGRTGYVQRRRDFLHPHSQLQVRGGPDAEAWAGDGVDWGEWEREE